MGRILVFQHVAWELLGTLNPLLKKAGHRIRYVNFARTPESQPVLNDYDALIVLGGPMNVDQTHKHPHLTYECRAIESALKQKMPVLGICLGAQLIAKALGAKVYKNHISEIGWRQIEKLPAAKHVKGFGEFTQSEQVFHWHGDTFDLPRGTHHLARSDDCSHQAFLYGDNVMGLQFHLEVDHRMIARWLNVPSMRHDFLQEHPDTDPQHFLMESKKHLPRLSQLSSALFGDFIRLMGREPKKKITLTSR